MYYLDSIISKVEMLVIPPNVQNASAKPIATRIVAASKSQWYIVSVSEWMNGRVSECVENKPEQNTNPGLGICSLAQAIKVSYTLWHVYS